MTMRVDLDRRRTRMLVTAVVVALLSIFIVGTATFERYIDARLHPEVEATIFQISRWPLTRWFGWVLIAPFCFELGWKYRMHRSNWGRILGIFLLGNAAVYVFHVTYQMTTMLLPMYSMVHETFLDALRFHSYSSVHVNIVFYWCLIGASQIFGAWHDAQKKALRAAKLESELANAHLDALKMQLHPHFLFNTLHGISTLMYRDVETADRMITRLSTLLRRTLERSNEHLVTLRDELDFLEEYLAIEQLRFGERMQVRMDIEPGIASALVPSFVFQPLVENAIKHGIAPAGNRGTITVGAQRNGGDRLVLHVADDGPGLATGDGLIASPVGATDVAVVGAGEAGQNGSLGGAAGAAVLGAGVGLSNLNDRLERLYGAEYALDLVDVQPSGLDVRIGIPFRK